MNGQMNKLKIKQRYEKITILLIAIIFSVTITGRVLVPVLKKVQKANDNLKVVEKSIAKVTDKSGLIEKTEDGSVLTPPKLEKETFLNYLKATKEWEEYLDKD